MGGRGRGGKGERYTGSSGFTGGEGGGGVRRSGALSGGGRVVSVGFGEKVGRDEVCVIDSVLLKSIQS